MFAVRLVLCPLLAWVVYKWVRPLYLELQSTVRKGWYLFTAIALIFYVMLSMSISVPTMITQRLEQLPVFVLQLILLPTIYIHIFGTLRHQQAMHKITEQENILKLQVAGTAARMDEYSAANEKFRVERHDFRHKMQTIAGMVEKGQFAELRTLALEYNENSRETPVRQYSTYPVIDAVLSSYLQKAEGKEIRVSAALSFPDPLPMNETELATVFANAIENAVNACEKLPEEKGSSASRPSRRRTSWCRSQTALTVWWSLIKTACPSATRRGTVSAHAPSRRSVRSTARSMSSRPPGIPSICGSLSVKANSSYMA